MLASNEECVQGAVGFVACPLGRPGLSGPGTVSSSPSSWTFRDLALLLMMRPARLSRPPSRPGLSPRSPPGPLDKLLEASLGDVAVLHSPFFGSGKLEYYLAARRRVWRCAASTRRKPAGLPALLLRLVAQVDRRFYFGHLLPGLREAAPGAGLPARTSCCVSRESGAPSHSSGRSLSSVRHLQRPPCNVTVRRQDALAYLRALPCRQALVGRQWGVLFEVRHLMLEPLEALCCLF